MRTAYVPVAPQFHGGPFKVLPFRPLWLSGLSLHDRGVFSALLELSWISVPACYLPNDPEQLRQILAMQFGHESWAKPISVEVLRCFALDHHNGLLYFPPLLRALRYMEEALDPEEVFRIPAESVDVATALSAAERARATTGS